MPAKLAIDQAYVGRQSLLLDLKILAATALAPLGLGGLIDLEQQVATVSRPAMRRQGAATA
jgi:hypothetical protein